MNMLAGQLFDNLACLLMEAAALNILIDHLRSQNKHNTRDDFEPSQCGHCGMSTICGVTPAVVRVVYERRAPQVTV